MTVKLAGCVWGVVPGGQSIAAALFCIPKNNPSNSEKNTTDPLYDLIKTSLVTLLALLIRDGKSYIKFVSRIFQR
jgi:hypothetical protein